jgi:DNA (cytosine-5)-methyltransferase 1
MVIARLRKFREFPGIKILNLSLSVKLSRKDYLNHARSKMKVVSLFAGIGGFDLALERLGHEIVYTNEWDKYAAQIYEKNFKHKVDTRSITDVPTGDIPDHDLLVGGFPCQAFSIAGKRGGFEDTRGTLFFEIARILKDKRPPYVLLENVKGLLSHDNGRTFETIMRTLTELGYELSWQVLNSKNFGVPQNRERVFIIGHLGGVSRPKVFPITGEGTEIVDSRDVAGTLQADYFKGDRTGGYVVKTQRFPLRFQQRNQREISGDYAYTLDSANTGGIVQLNMPKHSNDRVYSPEGLSPTLNTMQGGMRQPFIVNDIKIRKLTPTECERLQGFPDGWTEGVSDTQRYKQLGNAVTVNVVYEVARRAFI